nr:hypothetical protein [Rhodococcus jostii]
MVVAFTGALPTAAALFAGAFVAIFSATVVFAAVFSATVFSATVFSATVFSAADDFAATFLAGAVSA